MNQIESLNNVDNILNLLLLNFKDHNITVYGTWEEPLFKASEICIMLGIKDIRTTIRNLGNHDRHSIPVIDSIGRSQETIFLTETGLYKTLFKSRKEIAIEFQDHV